MMIFENDKDIDENDKQLKSVDRTQGLAGWALNRCCICRQTLYIPCEEGECTSILILFLINILNSGELSR